jgi:hypothetical protein
MGCAACDVPPCGNRGVVPSVRSAHWTACAAAAAAAPASRPWVLPSSCPQAGACGKPSRRSLSGPGPLIPLRIFLEETSLVARPAVGFEDLKERLEERLKWLGIKVGTLEGRQQGAGEQRRLGS